MSQRVVGGLLLAVALTRLFGHGVVSAQLDAGALASPPRELRDRDRCGTGDDRLKQLGFRPRVAIADGSGVSFRQEPAIITSDYTGPVTLREFTIAGDVATVNFQLAYDGSATESWSRTGTKVVNGRLLSVFEPSGPASTLDRMLAGKRWGWDYPGVYGGELLPPGTEVGSGSAVYLRLAPTNLPAVRIARVSESIQYTSHVVNIVVPGFGDGYVDDDLGFDFAAVTTKFYQYFEDSYDSIAIVPQDTFVASYGAFHRNVQNAVRGIGLPLFDESASYGSQSHRLRSVELFNNFALGRNESSSHEIAHQWGSYIDWTRLTGIARAGHQPTSHDPLWASGETLTGAVLTPFRRVRRSAAGWEIERTAAPVRFHPYTLYAMGLIGKESVPEITLFSQQDQFDASASSSPDPGRAVIGATRTATIFNVIGMMGERSGPVDSEWHRATVIVSRDVPLSELEMRYWTFIARRLEDPSGAGVVDYTGASSFEMANGYRIDLRTDIRPLRTETLAADFDVDHPAFGTRDWRDVVFDSDVPSVYHPGERQRWSGVVNARDHSDINSILIRFWKSGGTASDAILVRASVSSRSSFIAETTFTPEQAGTYIMEVFLFWPGSGSQFSRAALSPITIE
jgi:hypothetical protein